MWEDTPVPMFISNQIRAIGKWSHHSIDGMFIPGMTFFIELRPYPSMRLYDLKRFHASVTPIEPLQIYLRKAVPLCDQGGGGSALVPPGGGQGTNGLVVAGETVDSGLDENEAAVPR